MASRSPSEAASAAMSKHQNQLTNQWTWFTLIVPLKVSSSTRLSNYKEGDYNEDIITTIAEKAEREHAEVTTYQVAMLKEKLCQMQE